MVNGRDEQKFKKPRRLVEDRRDRLVKFAGLIKENPGLEFLVVEAAALYLASFKWSWRTWWVNARIRAPWWLAGAVRLVDRDYAALCREVDEYEALCRQTDDATGRPE